MGSAMARGLSPQWRGAAFAGLALFTFALAATPASAWWRGGVWIGVPPVIVGPGYYYPPPYYYPPYWPGYYYPPPGYAAPPAAPASVTASKGPVTYGSMCSCPGIGAPSYGSVN